MNAECAAAFLPSCRRLPEVPGRCQRKNRGEREREPEKPSSFVLSPSLSFGELRSKKAVFFLLGSSLLLSDFRILSLQARLSNRQVLTVGRPKKETMLLHQANCPSINLCAMFTGMFLSIGEKVGKEKSQRMIILHCMLSSFLLCFGGKEAAYARDMLIFMHLAPQTFRQ